MVFRLGRLTVAGSFALAAGVLLLGLTASIAGAGTSIGMSWATAQHGWRTTLEGSRAVVWDTSDGGTTWNRLYDTKAGSAGDGPAPIAGHLAFASPSVGLWYWYCPYDGSAAMLRTVDAGRTWRTTGKVDPHGGLLWDISFATGKVGWASTHYGSAPDGGSIAKTSNGGATWRVQKRIGPHGYVDQVSCPTARSCYVSGSDSRGRSVLWSTSDGGRHWVTRRLPTGPSIDFPARATGWAVGRAGDVFKTTNRGRTWNLLISTGGSYGFFDVSFCSPLVGYVAADGYVKRTTRGGANWTTFEVPGSEPELVDVECIDAEHCWVVDLYENVFTTSDGGATWSWNPTPGE